MRSKWIAGEGGIRLARFGLPISAVLMIAIPTFLARIVFLRELPVEQAARLVLFFAAVPLCAFVGNLGQSGVISRYYSRIGKGAGDWQSDLRSGGVIVLLPTLACAAAVSQYNGLQPGMAFALFVSAMCFNLTQQMSMMLVAAEQFTLGSALDRLSGTMLIFLALPLLRVPALRTLGFIVAGYTVTNLLILLLGFLLLRRRLPRGAQRLSLQERKTGAAFWLSSGISFLRENLLIVVVQPAVTPLALAGFDALAVLFRGFEIVRQPLSSIMLVDITRASKPTYRRRTLGVGIVGLVAALFSIWVMPWLLDLIYAGRYDLVAWMIPWLAAYHVLGWLYTIPAGFLFGRSSERLLKKYIPLKVIGAALILFGGSVLAYRHGFPAFIGTLLAAVLLEVCLAYGFLAVARDQDWHGQAARPAPAGMDLE